MSLMRRSFKDRAKEEIGSDEDINSGNNDSNKSAAHKRRLFVYTFTIMDFVTRLYLAHGPTRSQKGMPLIGDGDASTHDVNVKFIRLDKYSVPAYVDEFDGGCRVYVLPKNSALNGSQKWKDTMKEFTKGTMG